MKKIFSAILLLVPSLAYAGFNAAGGGTTYNSITETTAVVTVSTTLATRSVVTSEPNTIATVVNTSVRRSSGCIVFTFDDGYESMVTTAAPLFQSKGVAGTSYVITSSISTNNHMTAAQLRTLQNTYGWEIGSHSSNHLNLGSITEPNLTIEISSSQAVLRELGLTCRAFAYPYGAKNAAAQAKVSRYYESCRETVTYPTIYPINPNEIPSIAAETLASSNTYTLAIDSACNRNCIVTFFAHDMGTAALVQLYGYLIDYAKAKGCDIMTMSDALKYYGNTLEQPYYAMGTINAVGRDGSSQFDGLRRTTYINPDSTSHYFRTWYNPTNGRFKMQSYGASLDINPEGNQVYLNNPSITGTIFHSYARKTSNYTFSNTADHTIFVDASDAVGNVNITLPSAPTNIFTGVICKTDSSTNTVTILPQGSYKIDGRSSIVLTQPHETAYITADWDVWHVTQRSGEVSCSNQGYIGIGVSTATVKLDIAAPAGYSGSVVKVSSSPASQYSLQFGGAVDALPTTGFSEGTIIYNSTDKKMYTSTETVVGTYSWKAWW